MTKNINTDPTSRRAFLEGLGSGLTASVLTGEAGYELGKKSRSNELKNRGIDISKIAKEKGLDPELVFSGIDLMFRGQDMVTLNGPSGVIIFHRDAYGKILVDVTKKAKEYKAQNA